MGTPGGPVEELFTNNSPATAPRPALRLLNRLQDRGKPLPDQPLRNQLLGQLSSGRQLASALARAAAPAETLPTRIEAVDALLEGGLARGQLVELVGHRSSGRFATVLAALAAATAAAEAAALVDLGDGLDPRTAEDAGIDLERLLWLRPRTVKEALQGAELLLTSGFPLVALDLGHPPLPGGRGAQAFWLRLARAAQGRNAALLVSSPYRASGTAARVVLQLRRQRTAWAGRFPAPRLLAGAAGRVLLEKAPGRAPGQAGTLRLATAGALSITAPPPPPVVAQPIPPRTHPESPPESRSTLLRAAG